MITRSACTTAMALTRIADLAGSPPLRLLHGVLGQSAERGAGGGRVGRRRGVWKQK